MSDEIEIRDISELIDIIKEYLRKKHPMTEETKNFISEKSRVVSVVVDVVKVNDLTLKVLCISEKSAKELVSTLYDVIQYRIRLRKEFYPLWEKTPENNWVVENCLDIINIERDGSTVIIATDKELIDGLWDAYTTMQSKLLVEECSEEFLSKIAKLSELSIQFAEVEDRVLNIQCDTPQNTMVLSGLYEALRSTKDDTTDTQELEKVGDISATLLLIRDYSAARVRSQGSVISITFPTNEVARAAQLSLINAIGCNGRI